MKILIRCKRTHL